VNDVNDNKDLLHKYNLAVPVNITDYSLIIEYKYLLKILNGENIQSNINFKNKYGVVYGVNFDEDVSPFDEDYNNLEFLNEADENKVLKSQTLISSNEGYFYIRPIRIKNKKYEKKIIYVNDLIKYFYEYYMGLLELINPNSLYDGTLIGKPNNVKLSLLLSYIQDVENSGYVSENESDLHMELEAIIKEIINNYDDYKNSIFPVDEYITKVNHFIDNMPEKDVGLLFQTINDRMTEFNPLIRIMEILNTRNVYAKVTDLAENNKKNLENYNPLYLLKYDLNTGDITFFIACLIASFLYDKSRKEFITIYSQVIPSSFKKIITELSHEQFENLNEYVEDKRHLVRYLINMAHVIDAMTNKTNSGKLLPLQKIFNDSSNSTTSKNFEFPQKSLKTFFTLLLYPSNGFDGYKIDLPFDMDYYNNIIINFQDLKSNKIYEANNLHTYSNLNNNNNIIE